MSFKLLILRILFGGISFYDFILVCQSLFFLSHVYVKAIQKLVLKDPLSYFSKVVKTIKTPLRQLKYWFLLLLTS